MFAFSVTFRKPLFVFTNTDCGDCHTCIRVAVLDYFQFGSKETKSYLCYLSCISLCAIYDSANDSGLLMLLYILSANCLYSCMFIAIIVLCPLTVLLYNIPLSLFLLC